MATMLNGAAVMDAALLLIAANESCPQPQTSEHLAAVEIMKLENIIILQNKVDLIREDAALAQHKDITAFVRGQQALRGCPSHFCSTLITSCRYCRRKLAHCPHLRPIKIQH